MAGRGKAVLFKNGMYRFSRLAEGRLPLLFDIKRNVVNGIAKTILRCKMQLLPRNAAFFVKL